MTPRPRHALAIERDAVLEDGSDSHYTDPAYYARAYDDRQRDVDYYLGLAAEHAAGKKRFSVLEYGCGSGRITLPLARLGIRVAGVDRSRPMLAALARACRDEGLEVLLRRGDMRRTKLGERFDLVLCTFNTWLHLYSRKDVEHACARVREHLAPKGRFVLDVSVPDPRDLDCDPAHPYRAPRFRHPTTGDIVRYAERFEYDALKQLLMITMEFEPHGRPGGRWTTRLAHRQFFPQELEALLHYNGLEVVDVEGDFDRAAPERDAETLVYHCRARRP